MEVCFDQQPTHERLKWYDRVERANAKRHIDLNSLQEPQIWYNRIPLTFERVKVIEDYIGMGLTIRECADRNHIHYNTCCQLITCYFLKPKFELTLSSKV